MMGSSAGMMALIRWKPNTPTVISSASDIAQVAQTANTCERASPCFSTKAFCAPMATMRLRPMVRPVKKIWMSTPTALCRNDMKQGLDISP